jgi:hypothetical protein
VLQHLAGTRASVYHLVSFALWLGVMLLYFMLARRVAGTRAAGVATAGAAALAAWGLPVAWVAGVQDLWMMLLSLACLLAFAQGRGRVAALWLSLALLSKETAVLVPVVAFSFEIFARGTSPRLALRRIVPLLAVVAVWLVVHPLAGGRLWWGSGLHTTPGIRYEPVRAAVRTLLALVNLDAIPAPEFGWRLPLLLGGGGAVLLVGIIAWAVRESRSEGNRNLPLRRLAPLAAVWAAAGWLPLFLPSLNWHAYYALFGLLGAWLGIGAFLGRPPVVAFLGVALLALLRAGRAGTPSLDWGDEYYQKRAAEFLDFMRRDLQAKVPAPPQHSRFYFVDVPSNVGFLQGDGPALRVWYHDPTLRGGLFSSYQPRPSGSPAGRDLFFRYDSTAGWIEVRRGAEDARAARAADPRWREDHERLAIALSRGGDWPGTAAEYAKLAAAFPDSVDYVYYAGLGALTAGDSTAARAWLGRAAALPTADDEVRSVARRLGARALPGPNRGIRPVPWR